jgi:hypothetical protein
MTGKPKAFRQILALGNPDRPSESRFLGNIPDPCFPCNPWFTLFGCGSAAPCNPWFKETENRHCIEEG